MQFIHWCGHVPNCAFKVQSSSLFVSRIYFYAHFVNRFLLNEAMTYPVLTHSWIPHGLVNPVSKIQCAAY